jgi:hypothetical protein
MSFLRTVNNLCEGKLKELNFNSNFFNKNLLCNSFIAGGAIISVSKEEKIKDYDLFMTNAVSTKAVFSSLMNRVTGGTDFQLVTQVDDKNPKLERGTLALNGLHESDLETLIDKFNANCKALKITSRTHKVVPAYLSKNALTLSNGVQLIFRFIGEPKEVFTTFDYEHCKVYWRPNPLGLLLGTVTYEGRSQESIAKNELIYTGNTRFALSAISRLNKFIKRGWGVSPSSLLSLALTSAKIDWSNKQALEEELLGIYGIENKTLKQILEMCSTKDKVDLDKVVQVLGEV